MHFVNSININLDFQPIQMLTK